MDYFSLVWVHLNFIILHWKQFLTTIQAQREKNKRQRLLLLNLHL